jgi:geranylgeranyl diphosphate synthase, type I
MTENLQQTMFNAIEEELKRQVARLDQPRTALFHEMLTYHMGWAGEGAGPQAAGKRVRPLLVLLSTASCFDHESNKGRNGDASWLRAVSAAASVELIHNFSLVHDDIQDNSELRRGRRTVWVKWGAPMAINVGDALFVIANQAITDLKTHYPADMVVQAAEILNNCCLDLTRGQYLDMSYEERADLVMEDYWQMIGGKTSALLSACTHIGALLGYAQINQQEAFRLYGHHLGLAFQVQDDILGIWGDEALTGKSAASDLVEGKNSLPVLYALEQNREFAKRWQQGPITLDEVNDLAALLADEGGRSFAEQAAEMQTQKALHHLEEADPQGTGGRLIRELTNSLLKRKQ